MRTKCCRLCRLVKTVDRFRVNARGYANSWCRDCYNARERVRRKTEAYRAKRNLWRRSKYETDPAFVAAARTMNRACYWRNKVGEAESV